MSLIDDYKESFEEAEELLHTLVRITANAVDPKDFGDIRKRAKEWLNLHTGAGYLSDKDELRIAKQKRDTGL